MAKLRWMELGLKGGERQLKPARRKYNTIEVHTGTFRLTYSKILNLRCSEVSELARQNPLFHSHLKGYLPLEEASSQH
jgi:hypothetical protein